MKVGVAGLGRIGGGAARGLLKAGYEVVGYDVRPEALEAFNGNFSGAGTPGELGAASDVVFVAVFDDKQLRELLPQLLGAASPPKAIVVLSTVSMETMRWAAEQAGKQGVSVLDCGVSGGEAIERQEMVTMIGGDDEGVALVKPLLETFSDAVFHMGPVGAGMQTKIARNMYHFVTRTAAWEGVKLAGAAGVDPQAFLDVLKACSRHSGPFDLLDRGIGIGFATPSAVDEETRQRSADYAHKDLDAAFKLGAEVGVDLRAARAADTMYDAACELAAAEPEPKPVVIKGPQDPKLTAQTPGLIRNPGVSQPTCGSTRLWMGYLMGEPHHKGPAHHHGEAETASYVLSGTARVFYGKDLEEYVDVHAGEFLFVPAHIVHIEANPFDEPVVAITARGPDNIVVNLEDKLERI